MTLMSVAGVAMPEGAAQVSSARHQFHLALNGTVSGTWSGQAGIPDTGSGQSLNGAGTVRPLGNVQASGSLHLTGFIANGHATGSLTLTNSAGSLTLQLTGPTQTGFSGPPSSFSYTITKGTGRFAGAKATGVLKLQETPEQSAIPGGPGQATPMFIVAPQFTLTFGSGSK
jgi:hypothetical protein